MSLVIFVIMSWPTNPQSSEGRLGKGESQTGQKQVWKECLERPWAWLVQEEADRSLGVDVRRRGI